MLPLFRVLHCLPFRRLVQRDVHRHHRRYRYRDRSCHRYRRSGSRVALAPTVAVVLSVLLALRLDLLRKRIARAAAAASILN